MKSSRPFAQWFLPCSIAAAFFGGAFDSVAQTNRILGLDISAWQGNISQTTWNNLRNTENRQFVILRSSRGGTTGFYDQNDKLNANGLNTLSQRYDDPYFIQNVNRAAAAGMFVGTYHFSRPDIIASTATSGGIPNNGTNEADHFIQMAGPWMRPGYLPPVHDFEAGDGIRTDNELTQFCIDFSNRIYEKMGIRPAIYTSGNYAANILGTASASFRDQLAKPATNAPTPISPAYSQLWSARWPNESNPGSINVNNTEPKDTYSGIYGPWDDYGVTHPWVFWQYSSTMTLQSFNSGGSALDVDCAHGGIEFIKDNLIPAVWMNNSDGQWTTLTNWNSGQVPVQPVQGPGQDPVVGTITLPTPRLPSTNDTVILERPNASITVTLSSGAQNIRKIYVREPLNITGGSLTINYTPSWDSTTNGAQFTGPVLLNNAALNVHTLQVDAAQTFTVDGGTNKFSQIKLMPGATPATFALSGNATFDSWSNTVCSIVNGSGSGSSGQIDLTGGTRDLKVNTGIDLSVNVSIQNGGITKSGNGILRLSSANTFAGGTVVNGGKLFVNNTSGSGTGSGNVTLNDGTTLAGTGTISGVATIDTRATVAPGTETTLGTLNFASAPVLNGTNFFRIDRNNGSSLADKIARTGGALNFAGRLVVTNNGAALTGGEVFTLFSAASYSGAFTTTNLPVLNTGLNWYADNLSVNGTLQVNRKPSVSYAAFNSMPGQMLSIPIATLIGSGSDSDGDALFLGGFSTTTTNGIALTSDGTNIYYFNNADVADQFNYTLSDGHGGSATGVALIGQELPTPPAILSNPTNLTVVKGQNATFNVNASGTPLLSYQWRFNGTNIGAATDSSYTRSNIQTTHAGGYSVIVNNSYGSITSSVATLTVVTPPAITLQPQSATVIVSNNATFSVSASGTGPLSYQWYFQNNPVNAATSTNLVINGAITNNVGSYFVVVSNAYGAATSQVATLTLLPPSLLQVLWKLPPGSRSYLTSNSLPDQRGMTFDPVTRHVLLINKATTTVQVLDDGGTNLWTLNTTGVSGGTYSLLLIAAADDGAIYAANLISTALPFKIYRWANDNSNTVPTVAFSGDPSAATPGLRWGDTFDVRGSGTNTQILVGPRQGANVVLFTTANGTSFTPKVINLNGVPGGNCGLNLTFGNGNTFYGTTHTNQLRLMSFDPVAGTASTLRLYSTSEVPLAVNPIAFSPTLNMLAGVNVGSPNHLRVYDLSPTNGVPFLIGTTNFSTDNDNTSTGAGAARFYNNVVYTLDANNGLMAVRILVPNSPLRIEQMSAQPGQPFVLRGTGAVGNYAIDATSTPFTNWTQVTNLAIGISGTFQYQETATNSEQRFYRVRKQ